MLFLLFPKKEPYSASYRNNLPTYRNRMINIFVFFLSSDAADYYIKKENLFILHEDQKVHLAINRLGLTTLSPFNPL